MVPCPVSTFLNCVLINKSVTLGTEYGDPPTLFTQWEWSAVHRAEMCCQAGWWYRVAICSDDTRWEAYRPVFTSKQRWSADTLQHCISIEENWDVWCAFTSFLLQTQYWVVTFCKQPVFPELSDDACVRQLPAVAVRCCSVWRQFLRSRYTKLMLKSDILWQRGGTNLQGTICTVISDGQGLSVLLPWQQTQSCDSYKGGS